MCVKVESSKKSYNLARKEEWTAVTRETHAKADPSKSQEEVRKFTIRVERCNQEAEKVRRFPPHTHTHTHTHTESHEQLCLYLSGCVGESSKTYLCVCFCLENMTGLASSVPRSAPNPTAQKNADEGNEQPNTGKS